MNPRPPALRTLLFGFVAGLGLSLARAPLGLDLVSVPAVGASDAALFRAAIFLALALATRRKPDLFGERPPVVGLLWAATLGWFVHGLVLADWMEAGGLIGPFAILLLIWIALEWISLGPRAESPPEEEGEEPEPATSGQERLGLAVAGIGCLFALEAVARPLRLFGSGTPASESIMGLSLLVAMALGASAFGGLLAKPGRRRAGLAGSLVLTAATCLIALGFLEDLCHRDGLDAALRRAPWKLDLSYQGHLYGDLILSGRVLLLPGFLLGCALSCIGHRTRLSSLLLGAGLGSLLLPAFLTWREAAGEEAAALAAGDRVLTAIALCGVGAMFVLAAPARGAGARSLERGFGALVCVGALALAFFLPLRRVLPLSPWNRFEPAVKWVLDGPLGLLTVETSPAERLVLTLDRRRLTPGVEGLAGDEQRLVRSWEQLTDAQREQGHVLLVGQLTPERAFTLAQLGARTIDRTAAWHGSMAEIEELLFEGRPRPAGRIVDPREVHVGGSKPGAPLVVVPPVDGPAPRRPRSLDHLNEDDPRVVVWALADSDPARRDWGDSVLLSATGFEDLAVGVCPHARDGSPVGPAVARRTPLGWLRLSAFERERGARAAVMRRLAQGGGDGASGRVARALELHYGAQLPSSPFETPAQRTELDDDALVQLREGLLAGAPDAFARDLVEGLARILVAKREVETIYDLLQPVAERYAPWLALERALAHADMELLDPESAARRLSLVVAAEPYDLALRITLADALLMAERPADAARELRAVLAIQPGRPDVERRLAIALVRSGDPTGRERIQDLLLDDPDDDGLRVYLGDGPYPPFEPRFGPGLEDH